MSIVSAFNKNETIHMGSNFFSMFYLHYKQADISKSILGKEFCPDTFKEWHENVGEEKSIQVFVRLASDT